MAWHNAKDPLRREAYLLSQLKGLEEWRGYVVHQALETYFVPSLEQRSLILREELTEKTLRMAEEQYRFSERGDYKKDGVSKSKNKLTYLALREHECGSPIGAGALAEIYEQIRKCYRFLYSQTKFLDFLQGAEWYEKEIDLRFKFNGQACVAKPDLALKYNHSKLCIIDWKIGESLTSDYSRQLQFYALGALQKWPGFKASDLLLVEANLLQEKGNFKTHRIDESGLLDFENFIYRSLSDINVLTAGRPYSVENINNFAYANSPGSCHFCKFERLCVRLSNDETHSESVSSERFLWAEM